MNEPVIAGGENKTEWLVGKPLGGKYFVQRLTIDAHGRSDRAIAKAWVERLSTAIRSVDDRHMITVGVIPWAQVFKGAKPLFYSPEVGGPLDFVSVHLYPKKDKLDDDLAALKVYEVGKPLVIEEIFPLSAGFEQTEALHRTLHKNSSTAGSASTGARPSPSTRRRATCPPPSSAPG